ncbi:hypothetical protein D9M71_784680 [compost metagenome]
MVGPVAHVRLPFGDLALEGAIHELAEGNVGAVMVASVPDHEVHRYIERPFDVVLEPETVLHREGQQTGAPVVGIAPDVAAP